MRAIGIAPEDVKRLVLTHLHADHAGGVVDFPGAEVVLNRSEWDQQKGARTLPGFVKDRIQAHHRAVDLSQAPPYETFAHGLDLYGDGSIVLVETPGHSHGHLSVFVNLASGKRFLLAGDTAWVRDNYARPARKSWLARMLMEPGWNDEALLRLHRLSEVAPDVIIVPNHDPASDRDLLTPPDCYE
jgi:glyoxylase-like metal-dependent hydrolase (beta-lactamase superfamily II)